MFTSIIFIHELGHFLMAKYFKWNIDKIYFYPYGGYTKFNDYLNRPLYQELLIMLAGPLFQIIYYFIIISFLSYKSVELFKTYHYAILIFNLLPIYPLDGGKLLHIIFNYFAPFRKSFKLVIFISFTSCIIGILLLLYKEVELSFSLLLVIIMVICKVIMESRKERYYFNKFILERYLHRYSFRRIKVISNINDMYKDCRHVIWNNYKNYSEREAISKYFGSR